MDATSNGVTLTSRSFHQWMTPIITYLLRWLCPKCYVPSVMAIDPQVLWRKGIRGILIDLDNTLVPWHGTEVLEGVRQWISEVKACGLQVCVVSNATSGRRVAKMSEWLGLPNIPRSFKPRRWGFRRGLQILGLKPHEVAVVGDQVFTDILGGNRLGAFTILVQPLSHHDSISTKFIRLFERLVLRWMQQRSMLTTTMD
ncbi:MAG: YqeG family HAD IIIA-type phosphatase [Abditibacteriales bacterium]|nr:YqeG family HAD IIIA-type phosphatase [Abditibacteriales bacterium]MDW8366874.1 YqeG family HAD IIIA-type phosphatase [Abditibacteriales bacterium]